MGLRLTHIGQPFQNWLGVGNQAKMGELFAERRRTRSYEQEKIQ
jgi:hypothetical protein